jgi:hypothetical protein
MRYKALIILTVIAVITLLVAPSGAFAETHGFTQSEIEHAKSVHARHAENLLRLSGVQGVGIGEHLGRLGILILVDDESRLPHIPGAIEDMSAVTRVVGEIAAHAINLGVSGGNSFICGNYCAGGTIGFKVCDNTTAAVDGIITNNHVAASGCPNLCPNNASLGTTFFSPGVIDNNPVCTTTGATAVGDLNRFVPIVLDGVTTNYVDAAFVQSTDTLVSNNIQGLGAQNNTVVAVYLGQAVCKSGRTSGVTCGTVTGISLIVNVDYGQACGVGKFNNAIMYSPTAPYTVMSQPGDSGAPVVDANTNAAVALNFAGTQSGIGIGNPMGAVLSALQVSLCGSVSDVPDTTPPTTTASPAGGTYNSSQSVTLTCNDGAGSGCDTTYYCLGLGCNPTTVYGGSINISSSTDLRFYSTDNANNTGSVNTETYTISTTYNHPVIDKILGVKEPGLIVRVIGQNFGDTQGDSVVHIGPKTFNSSSPRIKLWSDTKIRIGLPKYQCGWFNGQDYKYIRVWVTVDGVDSNKKRIKVLKPSTCP